MRRALTGMAALAVAYVTVMSCGGGSSLQSELRMVPGLCFFHVHIASDMDTGILPEELHRLMPFWLCDSVLSHGSMGVSLLSIDLSDLSPQLLFLSHDIDISRMSEICRSGFGCNVEDADGRMDLLDQRGGILASISSKDGWTCVITGTGADRTVDRWLELSEEESLAADNDLVSISASEADITILVSHNSIDFLSVIPSGMLSGEQVSMLNMAKNIIQVLNPRALRMSLDMGDEDIPAATLEFQLVRSGGNVTCLSVSISDTELTPDHLLRIMSELVGMGS